MDVIVVSLPFSPNARQFLSAGLTPLASRSRHKIQRGGIHAVAQACGRRPVVKDRKSTRLNSSHSQISYAVFCLKKKKRSAYTTSYSMYISRSVTASLA